MTPADPDTVTALLHSQAAAHGDQPALSWQAGTAVETVTWSQYRDQVIEVAAAFLELGLQARQTVAIVAGNRAEHLIADLAAVHCGAATASLYQTLADDQLAQVIADARPAIIVAEHEALRRVEQVHWVRENRPHLIALDDTAPDGGHDWAGLTAVGAHHRDGAEAELGRRVSEIAPGDPLTYVYTSGTTGPPKGVVLTHANLAAQTEALVRSGGFDYDYRSVSFLPLAHIAERLWSLYLPLRVGGHVWCCPDAGTLVDALRAHRPSYVMAVPRVWEKLRAGIETALRSPAFDDSRDEADADRATLRREWSSRHNDEHVPAHLHAGAQRAQEGVLRDVRTMFGLDRVMVASSAAAPIHSELLEFFASLGIHLLQGYGLTETGGVAVCERPGGSGRGSVGLPLPGVEVKIAGDGEILLRGPSNTAGYRNRADATADLLTADGWLRTGDIGRVDEAGRVHLTDRKKELIITASGKNIAPTQVESRLAGRSFIDQALVFGEARPYLVALLTIDDTRLRVFADQHGLPRTDTVALLEHPAVRSEADTVVAEANSHLSRPEQVKRFVLLPDVWGTGTGELTPTLKPRRRVIHQKYTEQLTALYPQHQPTGEQ